MGTFGISFRGLVGGLAVAAGMVAATPSSSFGAAAAAKGITSISVKSTDAALNQITLAFDPTCPGTESYNVDAFQLAVHFDATKVNLVSTQYAGPFTALTLDDSCCKSTPTPGVSEVAGYADPCKTQPGAVNLFYETFQLKQGVSLSTPLTFTLGADSTDDYIFAVNSANPTNLCDGKLYDGPCDIQSSTITTAVSPTGVPLPPAYAAGGATLMLALVGAGLRTRGKRRSA